MNKAISPMSSMDKNQRPDSHHLAKKSSTLRTQFMKTPGFRISSLSSWRPQLSHLAEINDFLLSRLLLSSSRYLWEMIDWFSLSPSAFCVNLALSSS